MAVLENAYRGIREAEQNYRSITSIRSWRCAGSPS